MAKTAYEKGEKARRKGKDPHDNPHLFGTKYAEWDKGWRDEDAKITALDPKNGWVPKLEAA